jgi:hypothetical protein
MNTITQTALAASLASPDSCVCLQMLGTTPKTNFVWKINATDQIPWSYKFDTDSYYDHGDKLLESIGNCKIVPAYAIAELKQVFNHCNYTIAREGNTHQLIINGQFRNKDIIINVISETEADAFAAAVLHLIQNNLMCIETINERIQQTKYYSYG